MLYKSNRFDCQGSQLSIFGYEHVFQDCHMTLLRLTVLSLVQVSYISNFPSDSLPLHGSSLAYTFKTTAAGRATCFIHGPFGVRSLISPLLPSSTSNLRCGLIHLDTHGQNVDSDQRQTFPCLCTSVTTSPYYFKDSALLIANCGSTKTSCYFHTQADEQSDEPTPKADPASTQHLTISLDMQENQEQQQAIVYIHGWRLHVLTVACENPYDHVNSTRATTDILPAYVSAFFWRRSRPQS